MRNIAILIFCAIAALVFVYIFLLGLGFAPDRAYRLIFPSREIPLL